MDSLTFFGIKHDANGVHPDSEKAADIRNMVTPTSKKELHTFLRLVQLLVPFIPNLTEKSPMLLDLLKEDVTLIFESHHQASMDKIKQTTSE